MNYKREILIVKDPDKHYQKWVEYLKKSNHSTLEFGFEFKNDINLPETAMIWYQTKEYNIRAFFDMDSLKYIKEIYDLIRESDKKFAATMTEFVNGTEPIGNDLIQMFTDFIDKIAREKGLHEPDPKTNPDDHDAFIKLPFPMTACSISEKEPQFFFEFLCETLGTDTFEFVEFMRTKGVEKKDKFNALMERAEKIMMKMDILQSVIRIYLSISKFLELAKQTKIYDFVKFAELTNNLDESNEKTKNQMIESFREKTKKLKPKKLSKQSKMKKILVAKTRSIAHFIKKYLKC
jgi:hypothetical protein